MCDKERGREIVREGLREAVRERDLARERHGSGRVGHGGLFSELPPEKMVDMMVRKLGCI